MTGDELLPISPDWRHRLETVFKGILDLKEHSRRGEDHIRGESVDARVLLEVVERDGRLLCGSLQLALPEPNDLEMLKLGCWTLLYLKALFPHWSTVNVWVQDAADRVSGLKQPIRQNLDGYVVCCSYDPAANVLEFQVKSC